MIFVLAGAGIGGGGEKDFLRLHIRANSNSDADQQVKYLVKQKIVDELTPVFAGVTTKKQAIDKLAENLEYIEQTANEVLFANGFNYSSRAAIKSELFPTRKYTTGQGFDTVLPEGIYDALILELGAGTGDNWWCVVYPPLCFLENNIGGDSGVKYRSKIQEIIKRYF
jgi:stage II sporulation protein R